MPAQTKTDLITITLKEYDKLTKLIAGLDSRFALRKREEDTSIKDVIAHRAHWIDLFLGWYRDGRQGKVVHFPAEGYKWNDLKRYNAELRRMQSDMEWSEAIDFLSENHKRLMAFLEARSEDELYGRPMKGAKNAWTTGRWAEAAGPSHYRSASKYIRGVIRADAR